MSKAQDISRDRALLERLVAVLPGGGASVRLGSMFGWPAAYVGKKLAFCVQGTVVGIKVPAEDATRLINAGQALPFRPYGKPPMKEWVEMGVVGDDVSAIVPVLQTSVAFLAGQPMGND